MSNFLYKYGVVSTILVVWMMAIVSYATYAMFKDITLITAAANAAYATLFGLPAIAVAFYKWRNRDVVKTNDTRD